MTGYSSCWCSEVRNHVHVSFIVFSVVSSDTFQHN